MWLAGYARVWKRMHEHLAEVQVEADPILRQAAGFP